MWSVVVGPFNQHFVGLLTFCGRIRSNTRHRSLRLFLLTWKNKKRQLEFFFLIAFFGNRSTVRAGVVRSSLPLLLSYTALRKAKITLNLEADEKEFFGNRVKLNSTSFGHNFITMLPNSAASIDAFVTSDRPIFKTNKQLLKLHVQFGHCSIPALDRLLQNGKIRFRRENLKSVLWNCATCRLHSAPTPKPIVSLPIASEPN